MQCLKAQSARDKLNLRKHLAILSSVTIDWVKDLFQVEDNPDYKTTNSKIPKENEDNNSENLQNQLSQSNYVQILREKKPILYIIDLSMPLDTKYFDVFLEGAHHDYLLD